MQRTRRVLFLTTLLGCEAGAVAMLRRLGRVPGFAVPHHGVAHWAVRASTEDLFAVTARLIGLGLAWWLLAATLLSVARRAVPACRTTAALDIFTPVSLRRALDRAVAVGIGASLGIASFHPAGAATPDVPVPRVPTPAASTTTPRAPVSPAPATAPGATGAIVVVRAGDNLWIIAARALRASDHTAAGAVAPYWHRVVAANASTLRSRDPNLIFPGERVVLPPID